MATSGTPAAPPVPPALRLLDGERFTNLDQRLAAIRRVSRRTVAIADMSTSRPQERQQHLERRQREREAAEQVIPFGSD